jgi:hypothetical protein
VSGAAIVLLLLASACGATHAAPPSPAVQLVEVRTTIRAFMRALAAADGNAACSRLTPHGQASVIGAIGPELKNFGVTGCPAVVHMTGIQLSARLRRELRTVRVGAVTLESSSAAVAWSEISSRAGDVAAFFDRRGSVRLEQVGGAWQIDSL